MSLLFSILSKLVIASHPRNKRLLISWLQSPSVVILEPKEMVSHCFHCSPSIFHDRVRKQTWIRTENPMRERYCLSCLLSYFQVLTHYRCSEIRVLQMKTLVPLKAVSTIKVWAHWLFSSAQFSSVTQSCPILCHPVNCSSPGLPVHHQLPEFTQTHVDWVGVVPFSSCPQSLPASESFPMHWLLCLTINI